LGLPIPLLPIHILWINIITDGLPGLALTAEQAEPDIMKAPPQNTTHGILNKSIGFHILWVGLLMGVVVLITQYYSLVHFPNKWQTMVFNVLCLSQLGNVMAIRCERDSFFNKRRFFTNIYLWAAILITLLLQLSTIYIPILNNIFHTKPLSFTELVMTLALSSIVFIAVEIEKLIKKVSRK